MPKNLKAVLPLLLVVVLIISIDQLTKTWANHLLSYASPVEVTPFLNWTLLYNTGAAFSFLNTGKAAFNIGFIAFALIVCVFLAHWIIKLPNEQKLQQLSLLLILSGALGNVIDRLIHGHVIDFIELHIKQYSWPVFNIADSAITIGAVFFIIAIIKEKEQSS